MYLPHKAFYGCGYDYIPWQLIPHLFIDSSLSHLSSKEPGTLYIIFLFILTYMLIITGSSESPVHILKAQTLSSSSYF